MITLLSQHCKTKREREEVLLFAMFSEIWAWAYGTRNCSWRCIQLLLCEGTASGPLHVLIIISCWQFLHKGCGDRAREACSLIGATRKKSADAPVGIGWLWGLWIQHFFLESCSKPSFPKSGFTGRRLLCEPNCQECGCLNMQCPSYIQRLHIWLVLHYISIMYALNKS